MIDSIERTVADIHRDLGTSGAWIAAEAAGRADATYAADAGEELVSAVEQLVRDVPSVTKMSTKIKHNDTCHTRHVQCLADRIRGAMEGLGYSCAD